MSFFINTLVILYLWYCHTSGMCVFVAYVRESKTGLFFLPPDRAVGCRFECLCATGTVSVWWTERKVEEGSAGPAEDQQGENPRAGKNPAHSAFSSGGGERGRARVCFFSFVFFSLETVNFSWNLKSFFTPGTHMSNVYIVYMVHIAPKVKHDYCS